MKELITELCPVGQELWDNARFPEFVEEKYRMYVEHIRSCEECKRGLGIDEVIDEKDLVPLSDEEMKKLFEFEDK